MFIFFIIPHVIQRRTSHFAKLKLVAILVSFEMLWKGMNAYRGNSALVLVLLELNWEMVAAGITWLSFSSHLFPFPSSEFLGVLSPFFSGSKSYCEERAYKKEAG